MKLINIGFGNMVSASRLVAIVSPESAPIKRIVQDARDKGALIDATYGRRTRAVLITDSDHVILSAIQACGASGLDGILMLHDIIDAGGAYGDNDQIEVDRFITLMDAVVTQIAAGKVENVLFSEM